MADVNALSELIRKQAFLSAGGQEEDAFDKLNRLYGTANTAVSNVQDTRKRYDDIIANTLKKKQAELGIADTQYQQLPEQRALGRRETESGIGLKEAQAEYYRSGEKGQTELNKPATTRYSLGFIKKAIPTITDEEVPNLTIGEVNQAIIMGNQGKLNEDRDLSRKGTEEERAARRAERFDKTVLDYSEKLDNNFVLKELKKQEIGLDTANELDALTKQGNTVAGAALGLKQAKGMGEVGVMTDKDIIRYVQSGKLTQKAADILSRWMTGAPTPATLDEIVQINSVIQETMQSKIQPIYNTAVNRLSANLGISKEEAARRLDVPYIESAGRKTETSASKKSQPESPAVPTGAPTDLIQKQLPPGAKIKSIRRVD